MVHLAFVCALKIIRLIFLLSAGDKVEVVYGAYRQPQFFTMEVLATNAVNPSTKRYWSTSGRAFGT